MTPTEAKAAQLVKDAEAGTNLSDPVKRQAWVRGLRADEAQLRALAERSGPPRTLGQVRTAYAGQKLADALALAAKTLEARA